MSRTIYVMRDGELVEKRKPEPITPTALDRVMDFSHYMDRACIESFRQLYLNEMRPPPPAAPSHHFRRYVDREWDAIDRIMQRPRRPTP